MAQGLVRAQSSLGVPSEIKTLRSCTVSWNDIQWFVAFDNSIGGTCTHSRHLEIKSMKSWSLHLRAIDKFLEFGLRFRPLELVMQRGFPRESEKEDMLIKLHCLRIFNYYQEVLLNFLVVCFMVIKNL